jgi:hypothetical protein
MYPLIYRCLMLARHTSGVSDFGIRYELDGTRCSGDAHTSIGNGLINAFNTFLATYHVGDSVDSVHEGDDGLIGVDEANSEAVRQGLDILPCLGFVVKAACYNQIDDASFCGRHFYTDGIQLHDTADIMRTLLKFHTSVSNVKCDALLLAKAMSYYHTDRHTPLIGPLCHALISVLKEKVSFSSYKRACQATKYTRYATVDVVIDYHLDTPLCDITTAARVSCARRSGISIALQEALESVYLSMITRGEVLHLPKIPAEWLFRHDTFIYGDPNIWVR